MKTFFPAILVARPGFRCSLRSGDSRLALLVFLAISTFVPVWADLDVPTTLASFYDPLFRVPVGEHSIPTLTEGRDGSLYGTTLEGGTIGAIGYGTVFKITSAGVFTTLFVFDGTNGSAPQNLLQGRSEDSFYGVTSEGGPNNDGTLFKITPAGVLTTLVVFNGSNGQFPYEKLIQGRDGAFYGTTSGDGISTFGTVFRVTGQGVFTTLAKFDGANGADPNALVQGRDGALYGTAAGDKTQASWEFYKVTEKGVFTKLATFTNLNDPSAPLIEGLDGNFYGTTAAGKNKEDDFGSVFRLTPTGALTTLVKFNRTNGFYPSGGLIQGGDGTLYGTTRGGGTAMGGTVFKVSPAGAFTTTANLDPTFERGGLYPYSGVTLDRYGALYGTTSGGGEGLQSTFFAVPPSGGGATTIATFRNGPEPGGVFHSANGAFYGTTAEGGAGHAGSVYRISFQYIIQTITFPVIKDKVYPGQPFTLNATASSGLPITYSHTGPVSIVGNTVTLRGTGTVRIRAIQAGNRDYAPASSAVNTFEITAAP